MFGLWGTRTAGTTNSSTEEAYLPFYSVLFYCKRPSDWNTETYGELGQDSVRPYFEITNPTANFTLNGTIIPDVKGNPLIRCVANANDWKSNTGVCYMATTDMPDSAATLLNLGGAHTPLTIPRTRILNMHGLAPGDVASTAATDTYYDQKGAHSGHFHRVESIKTELVNLAWGELPDTVDIADAQRNQYQGVRSIQILPLLVDPKLANKDTKIKTLPKGVMVFGQSLSNTYFWEGDMIDENLETFRNGQILPIISMRRVLETVGDNSQFRMSLSSNTTPGHSHVSLPITAKKLSNRTNQTAYISVGSAGAHSHKVSYTFDLTLKSKILKSWVTKTDETPLANGMIIAYSIGPTSGYDGADNNIKTLPTNWHFCDGTNGTPDLRGYYIYANLSNANSSHDAILNSTNTLTVNYVDVEWTGNHAHVSDEIGTASTRTSAINGSTLNTGTATDIGNHTFESKLTHTHAVATSDFFKLNATDVASVLNIKPGKSFAYTPPSVELAFIMYNENII
jgi:hypothetical protein